MAVRSLAGITVEPPAADVRINASHMFTAKVTGYHNKEVARSIDPLAAGHINTATGEYSAPSTVQQDATHEPG